MSFMDSIVKKHLEQRVIQISTRLLVLEAEVGNAYSRAQSLANEQMQLISEVEALTLHLQQMELDSMVKRIETFDQSDGKSGGS